MTLAAISIDFFARGGIVHTPRGFGSYDDEGRYQPDVFPTTNIAGAVLPVSGLEMKSLPEGLRGEAKRVLYTRAIVEINDQIRVDGIEFKIIHRQDRKFYGGYFKAILGGEKVL